MTRRLLAALGLLAAAALPAAAQDTSRVVREGVRVVLSYTPGSRPGLILVPGVGLDSVRAILRRDLDFSDRFEVLPTPAGGVSEGGYAAGVNHELYRKLGASFAVEVIPQGAGAEVRLHDLVAQRQVNQAPVVLPGLPTGAAYRFAVHRIADDIVKWVTGVPGIAATRVAFVQDGRVRVVDSDGIGDTPVTPPGQTGLSPTWAPDGRRLAFTAFNGGRGQVVVQDLASGARQVVPGTQTALNITPSFAPDGRTVAYAKSDENGTNLQSANVAEQCCVQRLTLGRFADNLSPTWAPDGRRLAFVSTRAGAPQIYVMGADGANAELLVPHDFGATGSSYAPEWSPDGASIVFHRDVSGAPQLFVMDVATKRVRQLTSSGRNEDPTWAPDGRHIAFISDRSGRRQVWIIDLDTSRVRQLASAGAARLPAWSRRLAVAP